MDKRKEAHQRVKTNITAALIDLMQTKSYEEISISEIVNRAGVSRISYYRNYNSKEDILTENLHHLMKAFKETDIQIPNHTPARRVMAAFFHTAREKRLLFELLHQAGMDSQIQAGLEAFVIHSEHFPTLDARRTYPACLFAGALFQLLCRWYDHGMQENDTELSNIFCQYMDSLL